MRPASPLEDSINPSGTSITGPTLERAGGRLGPIASDLELAHRLASDAAALALSGSLTRDVLAAAATWDEDVSCIVGALAEGRLDAFVDDGGKPWDHAPATLIVEEAGGTFFDPEGGQRIDLGWVTSTNGHLDEELRALLLLRPHRP